jgi:hypothetical protein
MGLISLVVFANSERIGIVKENLSFFHTFSLILIFAWFGSLSNIEMNTLESSSLSKKFIKRFVLNPKRHLLEFYPSETIRARARFVVVLDFLSSNPDSKTISRKFNLFYQGVKIYNDHMKKDYGFLLSNPKRFYCQAKLAACSKGNEDSIRSGLKSLAKLLKDENSEPFEIVKSLKKMLKERATFKDVCAEIDAEPERMKRWFSKHSESVIGIVGLLFLVISIVVTIVFHI